MTSSKVISFVVGFLIAMTLFRSGVVDAANGLLFGSYNNAAKAVAVTSAGALIVSVN